MNKFYLTVCCTVLTAVAVLAAAAGYAAGKAQAEADCKQRAAALKREWRRQFRAELLDYADRMARQDEDEDEGSAGAPEDGDSASPWDEVEEEGL